MSTILLHTPEGVRDIYGDEMKRKSEVESRIKSVISLYGYKSISTPTFEFFDVFSKEIGTTPSKELYKFFDKEGNTLVLRPDFTPSMARCAAKYYMDEDVPIRFTYSGNTFTNTSNLQGKLKEVTQMGAELIGDGSVNADAEMIAMVINCLLKTGLKDFQISIGEVEYFKGLCQKAGLSEEEEWGLRDLISVKNIFAAEALIDKEVKDEKAGLSLKKMADLFGGIEILEEAKAFANNERSKAAIDRLYSLYDVLKKYNVEKYVSFDLGMLSKYNYYTGVIFKAYTYGVGDVIIKGGRYDSLLSRFGKDAPAIGFVVIIDDLMEAVKSQNIDIPLEEEPVELTYTKDNYDQVLKQAIELRINNRAVVLKEGK